jgi:acetyl esterase/lipase
MKAAFALLLFSATSAGLAATAIPQPTQTLPVWPEGVQGPVNDKAPERTLPDQPNAKKVVRLEGVTEPTLQVYPAPKEKANGTAVIICPGGGFSKLALDLEGGEVAANLNESGITAFVLKYRTSPGGSKDPEIGPVMDAQRSVALVRKRAAEFGVDPTRIGLLGISAGGQVAVIATSNHAKPTYKVAEAIDAASCRPDFLALVYPWKLQDAVDLTKLRADIRVDKTMPPVFIAHAADDKGAKIEGSLLLFLQLQAAGIPTEAHLYAKGGHGFGLRPADVPCPTDWPQRLAAWMKVMQLVK